MTSFTVTITNSYVTALLVQTSLYGLYMATFGLCLRWLLFADGGWKLRRTLDWPMLVATILIFVSNTTWLGANAQLTMESVNGVKLNAYQTYVLGGVTIAGTGVIILVTDAVMIYRCWKVYKKSWRITIPPVLCWLGWLFSLALIFYYNHKSLIVVTPDNYYHMSIHVHAALYSLNAATNIYTTTAIIYRIMNDASEASGRSLKRLHHLCRILAESGSLYTLTTIPPLVAFFLDATKYLALLQAAEAVNFSMAGIAFNLVLIRVGQSRAAAGGNRLLVEFAAVESPKRYPRTPPTSSFFPDPRAI